MRVPAKTEVRSALARLANSHMAPVHKARSEAIFASSKAKVDDAEDAAAHDVAILRAYIEHLEKRVVTLEKEASAGELEPIQEDEVQSACGCGGGS